MFKKHFLITLLLLSVLLASCAQAGQPGSSGADKAAQVINREWSLTSLNGQAPLDGSKVTLKLENGQAGGSAGCNSYGGQYTLQGSQLTFRDLFQTEMACMEPAGVMEQETAFLQTLSQAASFQVSGDQLELKNAAGETILIFQ